MRLTLKDIASEAGVSSAVVSAVLNESKTIRCSEEKRKMILELVRKMGYRPNKAAQALGKRKSKMIGVLSFSPSDPAVARIIAELERQLSQRGYTAIFGFWSDYGSIRDAFESVLAHPLDGLISMHDGLTELVPPDLPTVYYSDIPGKCCVRLDYRQFLEETLGLLAQTGEKKVGFFCWHREELYQLFCSISEKLGLEVLPEFSPSGSGFYADAFEMAEKLLSRKDRPDAIVCRNDVVAFAVINAAVKCGLRIPEDLSVTGFDDIDPAKYFIPRLTTCGAPVEKIVQTILDALFAGAEPGMTLVDMHLAVRDTCKTKI